MLTNIIIAIVLFFGSWIVLEVYKRSKKWNFDSKNDGFWSQKPKYNRKPKLTNDDSIIANHRYISILPPRHPNCVYTGSLLYPIEENNDSICRIGGIRQ